MEKLGGNDPCPCGSGRRFSPVLPTGWPVRRHQRPLLRPRLSVLPRELC
ncbi:MAG: SEC-C metal-binding domain-containing protein [Sporichthyaceae bacterium]